MICAAAERNETKRFKAARRFVCIREFKALESGQCFRFECFLSSFIFAHFLSHWCRNALPSLVQLFIVIFSADTIQSRSVVFPSVRLGAPPLPSIVGASPSRTRASIHDMLHLNSISDCNCIDYVFGVCAIRVRAANCGPRAADCVDGEHAAQARRALAALQPALEHY